MEDRMQFVVLLRKVKSNVDAVVEAISLNAGMNRR